MTGPLVREPPAGLARRHPGHVAAQPAPRARRELVARGLRWRRLLDAWASGSGGGGGTASPVKFGVNEAKDSGPGATSGCRAIADAYAKKSGVDGLGATTSTTTRSRRASTPTCRAPRTTCSPGSPATGCSSSPRTACITDLSDVWPIDGMGDAFKEASTVQRRQAVLRALRLLPVGGLLPEVGLREERLDRADDLRRPHRADEGHAGQGHHAVRLRRQGRLGRRWAPSTSSTCASTASTST